MPRRRGGWPDSGRSAELTASESLHTNRMTAEQEEIALAMEDSSLLAHKLVIDQHARAAHWTSAQPE
jgi:hypothetical protein